MRATRPVVLIELPFNSGFGFWKRINKFSTSKKKSNSYSLRTRQSYPNSCLEKNAVHLRPSAPRYLHAAVLVTTLPSWSPCDSFSSIGIHLHLGIRFYLGAPGTLSHQINCISYLYINANFYVGTCILKEHATQKAKIAQTIKQCSLNHIPYFLLFF